MVRADVSQHTCIPCLINIVYIVQYTYILGGGSIKNYTIACSLGGLTIIATIDVRIKKTNIKKNTAIFKILFFKSSLCVCVPGEYSVILFMNNVITRCELDIITVWNSTSRLIRISKDKTRYIFAVRNILCIYIDNALCKQKQIQKGITHDARRLFISIFPR